MSALALGPQEGDAVKGLLIEELGEEGELVLDKLEVCGFVFAEEVLELGGALLGQLGLGEMEDLVDELSPLGRGGHLHHDVVGGEAADHVAETREAEVDLEQGLVHGDVAVELGVEVLVIEQPEEAIDVVLHAVRRVGLRQHVQTDRAVADVGVIHDLDASHRGRAGRVVVREGELKGNLGAGEESVSRGEGDAEDEGVGLVRLENRLLIKH